MSRKPKFKPEITRVKLNPEQAVLACPCYQGTKTRDGVRGTSGSGCSGLADRGWDDWDKLVGSASAS